MQVPEAREVRDVTAPPNKASVLELDAVLRVNKEGEVRWSQVDGSPCLSADPLVALHVVFAT